MGTDYFANGVYGIDLSGRWAANEARQPLLAAIVAAAGVCRSGETPSEWEQEDGTFKPEFKAVEAKIEEAAAAGEEAGAGAMLTAAYGVEVRSLLLAEGIVVPEDAWIVLSADEDEMCYRSATEADTVFVGWGIPAIERLMDAPPHPTFRAAAALHLWVTAS